ncbi:MAG: hypothetical protein QOH68_1274 [Nocardioidaceae bacterium]|nr:hypothetical protein [Nocardioidaceae bacterium]
MSEQTPGSESSPEQPVSEQPLSGQPLSEPSRTEEGGIGRARLLAALRAKPSRGQLVAGVLCALLGFAVAVQVRANQDSGLSGLRQTDLVSILDDVTARASRLQAEARDLEDTKAKVSGGSSGSLAALEEARQRSQTLGILAGTLPAEGPGIELTITDPEGKVGADVLLDALQELRDAGGEAFEIGAVDGDRVRVIASTYISDGDDGGHGGIVVDGVALQSPYRIRVIGDSRTLAGALDIPGGVLDVLSQSKAQGTVTQRAVVAIHSLRPTPTPQYARPAPQKTG